MAAGCVQGVLLAVQGFGLRWDSRGEYDFIDGTDCFDMAGLRNMARDNFADISAGG